MDNNQKANITGQDTVIVWGGHLRVDVSFNWTRTGSVTRNGTGNATANTDPIQFAKNLLIDDKSGFVMWNLVDHTIIDFSESQFNITRISPYDEDDFTNLTKMMNHLVNASGFKDYFL